MVHILRLLTQAALLAPVRTTIASAMIFSSSTESQSSGDSFIPALTPHLLS